MLFKTKKYYSVSERIIVDHTERPTVALNMYLIFVEEFQLTLTCSIQFSVMGIREEPWRFHELIEHLCTSLFIDSPHIWTLKLSGKTYKSYRWTSNSHLTM